MKTQSSSLLQRCVRRLALVLGATVFAGSAQAAIYTGVWDPQYGSPFTSDFFWRGSAVYDVPDICVPGGGGTISNLYSCDGMALVTSAQVTLFDSDTNATLATLMFTPGPYSLVIDQLTFNPSGSLTALTTSFSNFIDPAGDLSAYGVGHNDQFALFFDMTGPRLAARQCTSSHYSTHYTEPSCVTYLNDSTQFPPQFTITRVPEPGTLALACLALLGVVPVGARARRLRR